MNFPIALRQHLQRAMLAPVLEQNERLMQKQEATLQANSRALEQFATAMSECAEQLARHTDAVKGIASASLELLDVVRQMNRMLQELSIGEERDGQGERPSSHNRSRNLIAEDSVRVAGEK